MDHIKLNPKALREALCINWAAVARRNGLDPSSLYHALAGRSRSARARRIIAERVGMPAKKIFLDKAS